jgi:cyclopropane fatty-acyl-phospholipid synthase-like methyltransferase
LTDERREYFEGLWRQGDYWQLETSEFDALRYDLQLELLADRRYPRALEIGCGAGTFTRRLAELADEVLAVDISEAAIERARAHGIPTNVEFRAADVMKLVWEHEGAFDLVVITETIYYLGWQHTFFDVAWFAIGLHAATCPGGRLLSANTMIENELLDPRLVRTYRDLFVEVGYELDHEETLQGEKDETPLEVLISRFRRADGR